MRRQKDKDGERRKSFPDKIVFPGEWGEGNANHQNEGYVRARVGGEMYLRGKKNNGELGVPVIFLMTNQ